MSEAQNQINIQRCAEAMDLLYKTIIVDDQSAECRGAAIRAIDELIISLGGANLSSQIEQTPWSKRMRQSGEDDLITYEKHIHKRIIDGDSND